MRVMKNNIEFKRLNGITYETFKVILEEIISSENGRKKQSGRPQKLSYHQQLEMYLWHLRHNPSYLYLGKIYNISEANCWKIIRKIEKILLNSKKFKIDDSREIDKNLEEIIIDATEIEIQNIKSEKKLYSGKQKKTQ